MSGLDSIYAMLARPVKATMERRRRVKELDNDTAIDKDSHEAPQSQLPPDIAHQQGKGDETNGQPKPRESVNKPAVERRARRTGSHIDIEV
ncbi:hypothetical protein [Shewanella litorisediminis]|uniref:Uncharacterized protein n=1 Tax=Shewanella litorisediminis TaxID=1173586 RepID=A0ABX7G467_9GAMM|nr:hypothetical protein [Shewanella litorisediminis]MCL2919982.1 hypothetical protein [Shewanella litorisediminis]QRH02156.1 hypothetical protein JQC75_01610 [Shewanella litorisediminis]